MLPVHPNPAAAIHFTVTVPSTAFLSANQVSPSGLMLVNHKMTAHSYNT